jgi:NhaP-type Na+/H+ or K+/H+ antiporter
MIGASIGAALDERHHLGLTTWRAVCRASGIRLSSLVGFTLELLPTALIGLLVGGLIMLLIGAIHRRTHAQSCVAMHAACALSLPLGILLCASPLPLPLMLLTDVVIAIVLANVLLRIARPTSRDATAHP